MQKLWGLVVIALLALLTTLYGWGTIWKRRAIERAFRADSIEAAADTSRAFLIGELHGAERRALQLESLSDSLSRVLRRTAVTRGVVRVTPRAVDTVFATPVTGDSIRRAQGTFYSEPYHVALDVALPPPPRDGRVTLAIRSDTARLGIVTQCGPPRNGIRPATIAITTPRWLPAVIESAEATQVVCNDKALDRIRHTAGYHMLRGGALAAGLIALLAVIF